jgi:hypothetical protein
MSLVGFQSDKQRVEILGRNRLIDELMRDNVEVAVPLRDRGIDLIAYLDIADGLQSYVARPIQMKAAWSRAFAIQRKYAKFHDLIIAYVWNLGAAADAVTYALSYAEAVNIAERLGWTRTNSWQRGEYVSNTPSQALVELLEPFKMRAGSWQERLRRSG